MSVRLPRLLDANLNETARLHPTACSLTLISPGVSQAQLTLPPGETMPAMHQWLELYTPNGSAGYFRVINTVTTYSGETQVNLRHAIDTLSDSVFEGQQEYTGTVAAFLAAILNKQKTRIKGVFPWQLGTVQDATNVKRSLNYDKLSDLLSGLEEEKYQYYVSYDFSTWPWMLNFLLKPQDVASEFRLSRNIDSLQVTWNDADLCTQLLLSVNVSKTVTPTADAANTWPSLTTTDTAVRTYNNAAAQAVWGIVQKTASIDTDDDIAGQSFPDADAWAARYMADHADPTLQIQIDGEDLYQYTFEPYDEASLGKLCRVSLPDYSVFFSERVVSIQYPDLYGQPGRITVSLANRLPRVTSAISAVQQTAATASANAATAQRASGSRKGGGGGGTAKELESWSMIVKSVKEADDATGITEMYESGILLDATTGVRLYSMAQGFVSQYAELNVQSGEISTLVRKTGIDSLGQAETLYSRITQNSDSITAEVTRATGAETTLSGRITVTATEISTEVTDRTNADSALSSRITQNANSITLKANKVTVDAIQTEISNLKTGVTTASFLKATTMSAGTFYLGNGTVQTRTVTIDNQRLDVLVLFTD